MERKQKISVRLSDEELNTINQNAEKSGFKTSSEYIREVATSGIKTIFYDAVINEEVKNIHEEFRKIAQYVHELVIKADSQSIGATIACNNAERQVLSLNSKMKYLNEVLKEIQDRKLENGDN